MTKKPPRPKQAPRSMSAVLVNFSKKAPALERRSKEDDIVNERPLAPGEKERIFGLIASGSDEEAQCAAVYVAAKLGILEQTTISTALNRCEPDSFLHCTLLFAKEYVSIMEEHGTIPPRGEQIPMLLDMLESPHDGERRFADIVIDKADLKPDTLTSW